MNTPSEKIINGTIVTVKEVSGGRENVTNDSVAINIQDIATGTIRVFWINQEMRAQFGLRPVLFPGNAVTLRYEQRIGRVDHPESDAITSYDNGTGTMEEHDYDSESVLDILPTVDFSAWTAKFMSEMLALLTKSGVAIEIAINAAIEFARKSTESFTSALDNKRAIALAEYVKSKTNPDGSPIMESTPGFAAKHSDRSPEQRIAKLLKQRETASDSNKVEINDLIDELRMDIAKRDTVKPLEPVEPKLTAKQIAAAKKAEAEAAAKV